MKRKFSVDRIEDGIAVCYDEDGKKYEFSAETLGLARTSLFEATLVDGTPVNVTFLKEETAQTKQELHQRTKALFNRHK